MDLVEKAPGAFAADDWHTLLALAPEEHRTASGRTLVGPFWVRIQGVDPHSGTPAQERHKVYVASNGDIFVRKGRRTWHLLRPRIRPTLYRFSPAEEKEALEGFPRYAVKASLYLLANADPDFLVPERREVEEALLGMASRLGLGEAADALRRRDYRRAKTLLLASRRVGGFLEEERVREGKVRGLELLGSGPALQRFATSLRSEGLREVEDLASWVEAVPVGESRTLLSRYRGKSYDITLHVRRGAEGFFASVSLEYRDLGHGHYGLLLNRRGSVLLVESD